MPSESFSRSELLLAATRRFTRAGLSSSTAINSGDIGRAEWHLMWLLNHWPDPQGAQPSALAKRLQVTAGSVAQQLRNLEAKSLIVRKQDKQDGRVVLVNLTARGQKRLAQVRDEYLAHFEQLITHLGDAEADRLIQLLQSAADFLENPENALC